METRDSHRVANSGFPRLVCQLSQSADGKAQQHALRKRNPAGFLRRRREVQTTEAGRIAAHRQPVSHLPARLHDWTQNVFSCKGTTPPFPEFPAHQE
jgi:hypothetical protein